MMVSIRGIVDKAYRADRTIFLRHGEKMVYGANMDKGLVLDGLKLEIRNDRTRWLYDG